MALTPGTTLGAFEITGLLGKGGMGEVYRARDPKLDREVAIKVLPEVFALDAERLSRFEREAKVLANLDHPNIGALYDFQEADGQRFLVMQLVEGETLADRIAKGPIPIEEALPLFAQIAEALEAAHEKGIIHRDLKPANIKIDESGRAKVLDFGLAMSVGGEVITIASPTDETTPGGTPKTKVTMDGTIIGTPAYMAPEQARGKDVDKRADIWAFGCCLYEALSGKMPFDEETVTDTLASVIKQEVDLDSLPGDTPWRVRNLIERCLEKDPQYRLRDIGDAWAELKRMTTESGRLTAVALESQPAARAKRGALAGLLAGAVAVGALATYFLGGGLSDAPASKVTRYSIPISSETARHFSLPNGQNVAISPDGSKIVFTAATDDGSIFYLRRRERLEAEPIPGTENARHPFFSPDSQWIGFIASLGTELRKVFVPTGQIATVHTAPPTITYASWGESGEIIIENRNDGTLFSIPENGGSAVQITERPDNVGRGHYWSEALPGGQALLFTKVLKGQAQDAEIWSVRLDSGETKLVTAGFNPSFTETGHLLYCLPGQLMAVPFDPRRLETTGGPVLVVDGIVTKGGGAANYAVSEDGTLIYALGREVAIRRNVVKVGEAGVEEIIPLGPRSFSNPSVSPDRSKLAVHVQDTSSGDYHLFIYDLERPSALPFQPTRDGDVYGSAIWTPDSRDVIFNLSNDGASRIYQIAVDGSEDKARILVEGQGSALAAATSISSDGTILVYMELNGRRQIHVASLPDGNETKIFRESPHSEGEGVLSPDGDWLAYSSDEPGEREIYVTTFPDPGPKIPISNGGGRWPRWSNDGSTLYFMTPDRVFAVDFSNPFRPGEPRLVYEGTFGGHIFSVDDAGNIFVANMENEQAEAEDSEIVVIENWFEELKRLVPVERD